MPATRCRKPAVPCQIWLVVLAASAAAAEPPPVDVSTRPAVIRLEPPGWPAVTGPRLRQTLDGVVPGLTWRGVPLREALRESGEAFSLSLVRDRRIDPTVVVDVEGSDLPLRESLARASSQAGGEIRVVGDVVFCGPPAAAAIVRTLVELRTQDLERRTGGRKADRRMELLKGQSIRWGDLTPPDEVLRLVGDRFDLEVDNAEALPHDLWAGAVMANASAAEALTLILIQFDLTFEFSEDLASISLVPLPPVEEVVVEHAYPAGSVAAKALREQWPGLEVRADGGRLLLVRATVERHEEIVSKARPAGPRPSVGADEPSQVPLERRRFTLRVQGVPARAVIAKLEESGIRFEYDAEGLKKSGVDLDSPVTLEVRQADANEFLRALLDPVGAGFEVEGDLVRLTPRK